MAGPLRTDKPEEFEDTPEPAELAREAAKRLIEGAGSHAIFMLDPEGHITTWSTPAKELYGYDAAAVLEEHVRILLADDRGEESVEDTSTLLAGATDEPVDTEGWHERADGSVFWASLTLSPLQSDGSDGFVAVCQDTTTTMEYKQMLERKNDRLKEFTDILAHDLRNPLNAIDQYLVLYEDTGDEDHLEQIHETTDRMSRLVEDLLRVAKQGDVIEEPEPTDIGPIIETAWDGAGTPEASLAYETVPTVGADPDRLCELFENLLRNAVEHGGGAGDGGTDTAGGDESDGVSVRVGPLDDGLYVEDDGPGISDEIGDEVFDHGVTTARNGSGYGLSIVRTIVNAHGWELSLATSDTGGARFEITQIEFLD